MRSISLLAAALLIAFSVGASAGGEKNAAIKTHVGAEKGKPPTNAEKDELRHSGHTELEILLALIAISGAVGGLATGIGAQRTNELCLPAWGPKNTAPSVLRLGFLGDMFIGSTASFAIHFVFDPLTEAQPDSMQVRYILRVIALGMLAGFMGIKVLSTLSDTFMQQLQSKSKQIMEEVHTQRRSVELLQFTDVSLKEIDAKAATDPQRAITDLDNAEAGLDQILTQMPNNTQAMVIKAKLFRRRWEYLKTDPNRRQFLEQAIQILTNAVKIDSVYDRAYYNRACYRALLGQTEEAMNDLQQAVGLFSQNRFFAKDDPDLTSLRTHKDWKKVVDSL